jgi:predicted negative regulator of RcsB-dependent stress response
LVDQQCLTLRRELGDHYLEANTLIHVGDIYNAIGDLATARNHWQQALTILEQLRHPDAQKLNTKLTMSTTQEAQVDN